MPDILWLDFETRSECDLKAHGVYNYALHPSTEVLCLSYAFDDEPVRTWTPETILPPRVRGWTGQIRAHNAAFERLIFRHVLGVPYALKQFYCTAAQARANCAPGGLEDVGRFAGAGMRKDHRGAHLIRKLCVPPYSEDPDLLRELIEYCEQDVRAMRAFSVAMRQLTEDELRDYHVNERINDRGVRVDVPLCRAAVRYATDEAQEIEQRVVEVTGGAVQSVRSPKMRAWVLERLGAEARALCVKGEKDSIDKSVRANLLAIDDPEQVPPGVKEVIQAADDLWASSVAKFQRLADLASDDSRVRGVFVFAGGSATGRAASYGAQLHNFYRKASKQAEDVRAAMVAGAPIVPAFGPRVTDVLRSMLRPALIPARGHVFVVADWSAIEGRVNPWLAQSMAGEAKLNIFRERLDPYKVNASALFNVAYADVTDEQRQIGKVQELACFSAETKVLTNSGAKAIVDVSTNDLLWDGQEWVTHQGVISKGLRPTINLCGVSVTEDHLFLVKHQWLDAKTVLTSKSILTRALETGSANLPYSGMKSLNAVPAAFAWSRFNALAGRSRIRFSCITFLKARLRDATSAPKNPQGFGEKIFTNMPTPVLMSRIGGGCSTGYLLAKTDATTQKIAAIQTTAVGGLLYTRPGEQTKPRFFGTFLRLMVGIDRIWNLTVSTSIKAMSRAICGLSPGKQTAQTNEKFKTCSDTPSNLRPVYDILNSGLQNRFTVLTDSGPLIAHNCGFGGGVGAFAAMGRAYGVNVSDTKAKQAVDAWRRVNAWAPTFWDALEAAYTRTLRHPGQEFTVGKSTYVYDGIHLWFMLPSGRILCYPYARFDADGSVSYAKAAWKPSQDAKEWPRARLWPGLSCENLTQATAHDLLRHALRALPQAVLHVHDEVVLEVPEVDADEAAQRLMDVMCAPPDWAEGLPLAAEVKVMRRYGK